MSGSRTGAALAAALVMAAGCSAARPAGGNGDDGGSAPADTARTAEAVGDTALPARPAAGDSALRALRDSARAIEARRGHGSDSAAADRRPSRADAGDYPHGPVTVTSIDSLRSLGPVYTPYDRGPVLRDGDYLDGLLKAAVIPVIRELDLSPETWARFWVLVGPEGRVRDAETHLGSGHGAFDAAAEAVARRLRYLPARRDGQPVPVWVLARVSLLMG